MNYLLIADESGHGAWYWAIGSTFVAVCNGLGVLYVLYKKNKRTDLEKVVSQYEQLLQEHKDLVKAKDARDKRRDQKIEQLEDQLGDIREEHRQEMERSWKEHSECLKRENIIKMRLDSHERALREAQIPFEELAQNPPVGEGL